MTLNINLEASGTVKHRFEGTIAPRSHYPGAMSSFTVTSLFVEVSIHAGHRLPALGAGSMPLVGQKSSIFQISSWEVEMT